MTIDEFQHLSIEDAKKRLSPELVALLLDKRGDWAAAHELVGAAGGTNSDRVHAYLHRKEGDQDNAVYWYNRAGKPVCREPLDAEWLSIVTALLG